MKKIINENGVVIVEASIVFPIVLFVVLLMIYMGNVYYQQAKLNSIVDIAAIKGAAYCADPMLDDIEASGSVPTKYNDIQPYRYLFGVSDVETKMQKYISEQYKSAGDGFFGSMAPLSIKCEANFNNSVIMYSFTVEATYDIKVPLRFMGTEAPKMVSLSAKATAPVNDNAEFINNIDMALDYYESSGLSQKVSAAADKIKGFFNKFGKD